MPQRRLRPSLAVLALTAALPLQAQQLNWMTAEEVAALPPEQQVPVPAWCGGTYHNPIFSAPASSTDTVLTADQSAMVPGGEARLSGDVHIRQPDRRLRADRARYDQRTGAFELTGNIRVETPELTFRAERMSGNRSNRRAVLDNTEYALFGAHVRGRANRIRQRGPLIHINQGSFTTCEPGNNGWLIKARRLEFDRESGWGEAHDLTFNVEGWPVLWIPWISFPINDQRKTGLLYPTIVSADQGGVDITQPLYLNLHPQLDATLAPRHIHGRGNGLESELRYLTEAGAGSFSHAWLRNDRLFQGRDRELARWHHDGSLGRWSLGADVNYVSDDFYFKDLSTGLEVSAQSRLPRTGHVRYRGPTWSGLLRAQSWQMIDPFLAEVDEPYRRLPQFRLTGDPRLFGPLHLNWFSDITRFDHSADDARVTGTRYHLEPALSLRLEKPWGYIKPRVRLYHTEYRLEQDKAASMPKRPERTLGGASLDAGLVLERPLFDGDWRQTLEPRLFLNKVEYEPQARLPDFDAGELTFSWNQLFRENRFSGLDRIGDSEKLALGITSRFIDNGSGRERLRLRAGQGFFREPRRVTLDGDINRAEQTPAVADAVLRVNRDWYARGEVQWNTASNRHRRSSLSLDYQGGPRRHLHLGYIERETRVGGEPALRQTDIAAFWPVRTHWSLFGRWLRDLDGGRSMETLIGVEYRDCCWNIRLVNQRELSNEDDDTQLETDRSVMLQIRLMGLGGLGGRVDALLERTLPGYTAP